jgi:hypothetical protein
MDGVDGAEVLGIEHGGLVALASRLEKDTLAARDLRAHWRVLEGAFTRTTVLPVRFGTVMESEEAVRERLLAPNAARLSALLEQMRGLVQLNVKGRYDEDELLREIVRSTPAIARLRERLSSLPSREAPPAEQIRLGQLVDHAIARHRADDTAAALAILERRAVAARAEEVAHPAAFSLAFLVPRESEGDLGEGVAELRTRLGPWVEVEYLGPLPPFSFADGDLLDGGAPWA